MQEALKHYALVFDAVYTPKITRLLGEALEAGAKIVTGIEMFIGQAYEQYERFTGLPGMTGLIRFCLLFDVPGYRILWHTASLAIFLCSDESSSVSMQHQRNFLGKSWHDMEFIYPAYLHLR